MKSKLIKSLIPMAFKTKTVSARLVLQISGIEVQSISFEYASSVYNQKHFPGPVQPAHPALCQADAYEIGATTKLSIPSLGL